MRHQQSQEVVLSGSAASAAGQPGQCAVQLQRQQGQLVAQLGVQQLRDLAERADGFDAADLEVLLDRALHIAVRRQLAAGGSAGSGLLQLAATAGSRDSSSSSSSRGGGSSRSLPAAQQQQLLQLTAGDLEAALEGFTPAAFWGTGSRKAVQDGVGGWQDVGGLKEARQALHEALELPTKYARLVAQVRAGLGWLEINCVHAVAGSGCSFDVASWNLLPQSCMPPTCLNLPAGAPAAAHRRVAVRPARLRQDAHCGCCSRCRQCALHHRQVSPAVGWVVPPAEQKAPVFCPAARRSSIAGMGAAHSATSGG